MASSLAAQLNAIRGAPVQAQRGPPSLLLDAAQAADTDIAALHQQALDGFAELCRADARFESFAKSLFGKAAVELNREQQDAEANARLDAALEAYLRLLCAYFLLPAATRTLEYLLRRFRIHVFNVDAAVSCALPYHATPAFVRLLQVLQLEGTRWAFLGAVRLQGAPPSRQALVQCIARDPGLVALVGDAAAVSAGAKLGSAAAASFYTLLLAETVASMTRVPEVVLARLMVFLAAGLDKAAPVEQQAGALLVLTQMADRVQFALPVTESLLVSLAKTARPPLEPYALQAMLQLARTQAVTALPAPAITYLAKLPNLPSLLIQLSTACDASALLSPLLVLLAERLGAHAAYRDTLAVVVRSASLSSCAEPLAACLISALSGQAESMDDSDAAASILRALRRRFPGEVDRASAQSLRNAKTAGSSEVVAATLRTVFGGTPAQPVAGHDGVALEAGLNHPSPQVRLASLRELEKVLLAHSTGGHDEDSELMQPGRLRDALLACVRDASQQSSAVAVGLPSLATLVADDSALFSAARDCLVAAVANVSGNAGGKSSSARAAVKRALRLLAVDLPRRSPVLRDASASLLVGFLLDGPSSGNVGSLARKLATGHPLFEALSAAGLSDDSSTAGQQATVGFLGDAFAGAAGHTLLQWVCTSWPEVSDAGRLLLLLALVRALAVARQAGPREALAMCIWDLVKQDSSLLCTPSSWSFDAEWKDGLPQADLLAAWAPTDPAFSGSVRRRVLLAAVADLPMEKPPSNGVLASVFALSCDFPTLLAAHADAALSRASLTLPGDAFLCDLVGADPGEMNQAAQLRACSLLGSATRPTDVLPHLLVALASPRRAIRRAAADSLGQLSSSGPPAAKSSNTPFASVAAWLAGHREALLAGGNAPQLLAALLSSRGAAGVALRRMVLDLLGSCPRPYAALQLLRGLSAVDEETGSIAAALQPLWVSLCQRTTFSTQELALAEACASALAVASASPQGNAAWALLSGALLRPVACGMRSAVLRSLDASVFATRLPHEQEALLARCLLIAAHDELEDCRSAARRALLSIGPDADALARLLHATSQAITGTGPGSSAGETGWLASMDAADVLTSVLESFAWHPVTRPAALLAPIFSAADALLDVAANQAPQALNQDEATGEDPGRATLHYRITQAMDGAAALVRAAGPNAPVSVSVAIRALRSVPDNGVHRAALELLSACAQTAPERVADDVADVTTALAVEASTGGDDRAGARALQEAFSAMAACWVTARPNAHPFAVVDALVDVLPAVPEHHRLPLLLALLRPLPSPQALTHALQLLVAQPALSDFAGTVCASRPAMECFSAWQALVQRAATDEDLPLLLRTIQFATRQLRAPVHAAWARREYANPALQASLSGLVVLAISLLQRFSGPSDTDERSALQQLLAGVENLMPPATFLRSLVLLAAGEEAQVQRRALRLAHARLQSATEALGASADEHVALIEPLITIVARQGAGADGKGTALEVLTELVLRHGPSPVFADALMPSLHVLFVATQHSKPAFAARALECLKAVMALGTRLVPILPDLVPALLSVLEGDCTDSKRTVAALDAVAAMVDRLDAFLSPFMPKLLTLLLAPGLVQHAAPGVLSASAAARLTLATRMPARLALPALLAVWEATLQLGLPCAVALVRQLAALVKALDASSAAAHDDAVFAFSLRILDVRRSQPQCAELDELEDAGLDVAVSLVLQLSEARFTPLFMTALEWSRARSEGLFRPLAFFRLVSALAAALRSVFVPFFRHLLADAVTQLEDEAAELEEASRPAKKPRAVHAAAAAFTFRLRTEVMRALGLLFMHDDGEFLDEGRFSKLLPPLVRQLELPVPLGVPPEQAVSAEATLVDSLSLMARCAGQDALWRQLNRSVLLATRSETPRARRLGLEVVIRMVDTLAEEYLTLLPETLPFLAELLEDGDEEVEAAARRLVESLSRVSEEDVLELLK